MTALHQRLQTLPPERLRAMRRGIEKESLRALPGDGLALTPHPTALGKALTHPHITTDYSESQLELITGVHASTEACLDELTQIHQAVYRAIGEERLWVGSMPCGLPTDETIPLGRYGASNVGRAKSVYRMGLGLRYGRRMQTISGIHYNWSMPGLDNAQHFALIRNFRRHAFVLLALFGASPAVCPGFVAGRQHELLPLPGTSGGTLHLPHATSLRMGRIGYQSDAQATLAVSYNSLENYANSLHDALVLPYPLYQTLGIRNPGGDYNQLATSLLQIENEFYGLIRPKRVIRSGERPLHALRERGVEYIEVRCLDLDPFEPVGITAATMRFIDMFLLHCLLADSPPDTPDEIAALGRNQHRAASRGRMPGQLLELGEGVITLAEWALEVLAQCEPIAEMLDRAQGGSHHRDGLAAAQSAMKQPESLPSARVLATLQDDFDGSYTGFIHAQSEQARDRLLGLSYPPSLATRFAALAAESVAAQQRIEAADQQPFEQYREAYLSPERLTVQG